MNHEEVPVAGLWKLHVFSKVVSLEFTKLSITANTYLVILFIPIGSHLEAKRSGNVVNRFVVAVLVFAVSAGQSDPVAVDVGAVDLPYKVVGANVGQDDGLHPRDPLLDVLYPAEESEVLSQIS